MAHGQHAPDTRGHVGEHGCRLRGEQAGGEDAGAEDGDTQDHGVAPRALAPPQGQSGDLAPQHLVQILALLDPDELSGEQCRRQHGDRQDPESERSDPDEERVPHSSTSR